MADGFDFGTFSEDPFGGQGGSFTGFDPGLLSGLSGEHISNPFGGGDVGVSTGISGELMVFDTQTGQPVSFSSLAPVDQTEFSTNFPQAFSGMRGMTPPSLFPGEGSTTFQLPPNLQTPFPDRGDPSSLWRNIGLGLNLGAVGVGLAGLIQKMVQGDKAAATQVKQVFDQSNPQQQAALTQAIQGFQQLQGILGGADLPGLLRTSAGLQQTLGRTGEGLARGQLNLSPELQRTVEEAFTPQLGDIARRLIEAARTQGFAGGAELLTQAPASALGGPALAALQGQQAQAKLALAANLPQVASGILRDINPLELLRLFATPATGLGGIGTGLQATQGRTQTTQGPSSTLFDFFPALAGLFNAAGGAVGTFSGLQRPTASGT